MRRHLLWGRLERTIWKKGHWRRPLVGTNPPLGGKICKMGKIAYWKFIIKCFFPCFANPIGLQQRFISNEDIWRHLAMGRKKEEGKIKWRKETALLIHEDIAAPWEEQKCSEESFFLEFLDVWCWKWTEGSECRLYFKEGNQSQGKVCVATKNRQRGPHRMSP